MVAFASMPSFEPEAIERRRELVEMDGYLAALSQAIDKTFNDRVTIAASVRSDSRLEPRRAECVGLIFSIAAVNALKHGFPDGANGKIEVRFRRVRDAFEMKVSDDGVGFDPCSTQPGRGIELMRDIAAQLHGAIWFEESMRGTALHLSFPVCDRATPWLVPGDDSDSD